MGTTRPLGEIYGETRLRVGELAMRLSDVQLATMLPTCPEWNVRDVIGHMVGLIGDMREQRLEGAGTPAWTAAQVQAHRHQDLRTALGLWDERAAPVEPDFESVFGQFAPRLVSDTWNHEQDIRGALHLPAAHRDSDAIPAALVGQMEMLTVRLDEAGLPALRMVTGDGAWQAGTGEAVGRVDVATPAELLRILLGRRSRAQMASLDWQVPDRDAYLAVFPRFGPAEHDIHE